MELEKLPKPMPSTVWLSLVVGLGEMLQHTPRAATPSRPSYVTSPPQAAEVKVISLKAAVVTVGRALGVKKLFCSPYTVSVP